jgi:hypothetical protein
VPAEWLAEPEMEAEEQRKNYVRFLTTRLAASETFVQEAENAREELV